MSFSKCPECGETNHHEVSGLRDFSCGFRAFYETRAAKCSRQSRKQGPSPSPDQVMGYEAARYRLALLDAALVADTIATDIDADMAGDRRAAAYSGRCRDLARQLRAFAGHAQAAGATFDDLAGNPPKSGFALMTLFRKARGR